VERLTDGTKQTAGRLASPTPSLKGRASSGSLWAVLESITEAWYRRASTRTGTHRKQRLEEMLPSRKHQEHCAVLASCGWEGGFS